MEKRITLFNSIITILGKYNGVHLLKMLREELDISMTEAFHYNSLIDIICRQKERAVKYHILMGHRGEFFELVSAYYKWGIPHVGIFEIPNSSKTGIRLCIQHEQFPNGLPVHKMLTTYDANIEELPMQKEIVVTKSINNLPMTHLSNQRLRQLTESKELKLNQLKEDEDFKFFLLENHIQHAAIMIQEAIHCPFRHAKDLAMDIQTELYELNN